MSAEENAQITRELYEAWNERDLHRAVSFAADDIEVRRMAFDQTFRGKAEFRKFMEVFATAFPDMKKEVTNHVAAGDQVVMEIRQRGTHRGPLKAPAGEIPPTGRSVELYSIEVLTFRDGKVTSLRNYSDTSSLMRQLHGTERAVANAADRP